jgi:hypothetical protein
MFSLYEFSFFLSYTGTRVIALFKGTAERENKKTFYSGIIAETPGHVNGYRLVPQFDQHYNRYIVTFLLPKIVIQGAKVTHYNEVVLNLLGFKTTS